MQCPFTRAIDSYSENATIAALSDQHYLHNASTAKARLHTIDNACALHCLEGPLEVCKSEAITNQELIKNHMWRKQNNQTAFVLCSLTSDKSRHILDNYHLNTRTKAGGKTAGAKARKLSLQAARHPPLLCNHWSVWPSMSAMTNAPLHMYHRMLGGEWGKWGRVTGRMEREERLA